MPERTGRHGPILSLVFSGFSIFFALIVGQSVDAHQYGIAVTFGLLDLIWIQLAVFAFKQLMEK